MTKLLRIAAAPVLLLLALTGLSPAAAADPAVINIDNFTFGPQTVTVRKGSTVQWVNRDDTPHRVVGDKNEFKSPVLDTDEKFSWTFQQAGNFPYFCSLHPHMTGKIVVTD